MKKKTKILLLYLTLPLLLLPIDSCFAWKNGSYAYTNIAYDYSTDYGTHDWIAEAALDALVAAQASTWSWLNERETIYLLGTEAPDNSGISITLDGTAVTGFGDTTWHHIYYNEDGSIAANEDDSGLRAKACGDLADSYIVDNKLDLAAFYLGAMTHYIADLSVFCHVAPNNVAPHNVDFDLHHTDYESYVYTRTNAHDNREEFFKISSFSIGSKTPYQAATENGWDTYKDPAPSEATTRDAKWLHDNFFASWASSYANRASESAIRQSYYNRVEDSLNNGIQACAAAMNNIAGSGEVSTFPVYPLPILIGIMSIVVIGLTITAYKKKQVI